MKAGYLVTGALIFLTFISCDVFRQTSEVKNFASCNFQLESIENLKLAGINIQGMTSASQLSLIDFAKISSAVASGVLPLTFDQKFFHVLSIAVIRAILV